MTYEEYLEQYGIMTYRNIGTSMLPLLKQGRDLFTVEKKTQERCKKYDVVLYRRPPAEYILHRVIEVKEDSYVILGDNCEKKEYGIRDEDILGVMTGFVHKGKTHSCSELSYRLYSKFWVGTYPVRVLWRRVKRFCKRILSQNVLHYIDAKDGKRE